MGSAYEGSIISLMSKSREGERFKTFDEIFQSDFILRTDPIFKRHLKDLGYGRIENGKVNTDVIRSNFWLSTNSVLVYRCDVIEFDFSVRSDYMAFDDYYMLPETLIPTYESFFLGARSPFYDKIQNYFNLFFESGIRQHIKDLLQLKNENFLESQANFISSEKYLLNFDDLFGVFLVLTFGHLISLTVFIVEFSTILKKISLRCC